ncbi:juxtaposed with another zinc finger protein 1 [Planococcus citri]|uniref:juxtaposed with another zinc finger protein 1 n=1 Tax=Planococcus citri TaxID=170843 RepID=UPI0031F9DC8F
MAVFKLNICKFNNCDLIFNNLENLIRHIETNHINYDPKIIEQFETQQPTCLPLSYVLKFFADQNTEENSESKLKQTLLSPKSTGNSNIHASENTEIQAEDANNNDTSKSDSWVAVKTANNGRVIKNVCKVKKTFKCHCGKTYGTSQSLRKHAIQCHNAAVITAQVKEILQQGSESGTVNGLVQPYQSIQLKQISNAGTPLKTLVVSTKPTTTVQTSQSASIQSPQRLMIQLSDISSITSSS